MLYDLMTEKPITKVPYEADYKRYLSRMTATEIAGIRAALNLKIDKDKIHTAGWMPGKFWADTPYLPIYEKAARHDQKAAALCFGLMVWEVFMLRPERWTSGRFEKDGEELGSRTYFKMDR